ncbi:DNA-binding response regulator, OmpR family, contains REC and winged-helix (wHTH) domain [Pseudonocardia ammonioxydans]|uniref:DNA-binding response regulator, OmpR family, contains REC and winged-helix (WHTH) domain n=1 Tax=Pseudonocardia ammonioxydans TaxID=260086 RepID=A0A1I5GQ22_PSUAM|nr:response regulator transcription factor [Pseudonocardia ammonioxydans]SFO38043.1 DNA-binding response regulator, OmpR family, contains REC and winged-helix (wHTH) domain [Pseudonocardia ammonioxydans]
MAGPQNTPPARRSRPRVLLVDDDVRIGQALGLALDDEGFEVDAVLTGEEALERAGDPRIDLVLLDLMLPGMDGFTVCRRLRDAGDLPIIMVTARSDSADVITGLEAGADDYVTKPLVAGELAARMRALLRRRRPAPAAPRRLVLGDVELRPDEGLALRAGDVVHLTRTEFRLLAELAAAQGRIVTRDELLARVWGYEYHGDTRLLDVHVRRLRRKIETDPDHPALVLTVRGAGYKIDPVAVSQEAPPPAEPVTGPRG